MSVVEVVKQSDLDWIEKFFEPAPRYRGRRPQMANITAYRGKHILEHHRAERYMSSEEFVRCMVHLGINVFRGTGYYPIRLRKQYGELWKCM
jgi:hypothetical protein|tara:strand:- start:165 stop:440 length:276 start_codon:yes stop_codon:yes gene_type:complete